jgi:chaperonin GroES
MKKNLKSTSKPASKAANKGSMITPLGDRVLVRPLTIDEVRGESHHFGIILPDNVSKEKSAHGVVVSVGTGRYVDGKLVPVGVKVGETVIFSKYSYDEVELDGEELYLLREDNLLAVIRN